MQFHVLHFHFFAFSALHARYKSDIRVRNISAYAVMHVFVVNRVHSHHQHSVKTQLKHSRCRWMDDI